MAKPLDFSYSRMGMYLECPRKYHFRYIKRIPEKPRSYFAFGHSVHNALQFLYDPQKPSAPTEKELLAEFSREWRLLDYKAKGYSSPEQEEKDFDAGKKMVSAYYSAHKASLGEERGQTLAVEFKTTVELDGLAVIGIIDRVDWLGGGKLAVTDYKTGKNVEREPDQLHMYQKILENSPALRALAGKRGSDSPAVERLSFLHVPSLSETAFPPAAQEEMAVFWKKVLSVADCIRAAKFSPTPSEFKCRFCDYSQLCLPQEAAPAPAPADAMASKINRLGEIEETSAKLGREAESLRCEIAALMSDKKISEAAAGKYSAALSKTRDWAFPDEKALLSLIKELGLSGRILAPTKKTVSRLLSDETLAPETLARLRALAKKIERTEIRVTKK